MSNEARVSMSRMVKHCLVDMHSQPIELYCPGAPVGVTFMVGGNVSPETISVAGHLNPVGGGDNIEAEVAQDGQEFELTFRDVPAGTYTLWAYGVGEPPQPSDNCEITVST